MKSSRLVVKRRRKTTKNEINSNNGRNTEPDVVTISSSSSDSQSNGNPGSESDDREAKTSDITNNTPNDLYDNDDDDDDEDDGKENEEREDVKSGNLKKEDEKVSAYKFPMRRVQRIVRSEGSDDLRVTQEAILLINKASEKFLELFCEDAYAASVEHHKNYVAYNHLSSIVSKERRFDFLSDFIPEKVKADDALKEKKLAMA